MNAPTRIEREAVVNMTSKGQVLIPKELRERHGLKPGEPVRVGENDRGETVILPVSGHASETREEKRARIRAALESARGSIDLGGRSTDEFMKWLRGDWEP
jgi:antitoxin PrlF